ncbi:MAG TPA: hypothetical protein VGJ03_15915 [Acidimicrobiales bacterium]|jgi:hypothetical protein
MRHTKLRCTICGAKNSHLSVDRCRICGGILPGAAERKKATAVHGDSFKTIVETEIEAWRDYMDGKSNGTTRTRRPSELPPVFTQTAVPGQALSTAPPDAAPSQVPAAAAVAPVASAVEPDAASEDEPAGGRLRRFLGQ